MFPACRTADDEGAMPPLALPPRMWPGSATHSRRSKVSVTTVCPGGSRADVAEPTAAGGGYGRGDGA